MSLTAFRRSFALLVLLAIALGLAAQSAQAVGVGAMMPMGTATADMSDPHGCCEDGRLVAMDACFALCSSAIALPTDLSAARLVTTERVVPHLAVPGPRRAGPPDPHPPQSIVLT